MWINLFHGQPWQQIHLVRSSHGEERIAQCFPAVTVEHLGFE